MERVRFIGVHHRHQLSIANVEDVIFDEKPDIVCVELPPDDYLKFLEVRFYLETEFKIAMISGCDIGARIFLIDWEKEELKKRLQDLISSTNNPEVWEKFEEGNIPAFLRLIKKESSSNFRKVQRVLLKERNAVLAKKVLMLKKRFPHQKFVVTVGMSHVEGVKSFLKNPSNLDDFLMNNGIVVKEAREVECKEIMHYQ